jgi:hypothetical protein
MGRGSCDPAEEGLYKAAVSCNVIAMFYLSNRRPERLVISVQEANEGCRLISRNINCPKKDNIYERLYKCTMYTEKGDSNGIAIYCL